MADQPRVREGNRKFVWFTPTKRHASEYEMFTIGQQSSPRQWLVVDWPLRFDDGRAPYTDQSTAVRSSDWERFRDPSQVWYRPYVVSRNHEEHSLDRFVRHALDDGLAKGMNPEWVREVLGRYYAAWPFVEYGLFLSLCYAVREALGDSVMFALVFEAADKVRHLQDIVHLTFDLAAVLPDYDDEGARSAWMEDPTLVPARENVERIFAADDWAEMVVAVNLVFEPLVGDLAKTEFFARAAPWNGDPVTPMILAGVREDSRRQLATTEELVRMLLSDPEHGDHNRDVISGWVERWTPVSVAAARALEGLFSIKGIEAPPFEASFELVQARQRRIRDELQLR